MTADSTRLRALLSSDAPLTWVLTGDSITHGLIHTRGARSYPEHLHELIRGDLGRVQDIVINSLQNHTYFALLRIRKDGELIEVDARPSDAIALAVQFKPHLPIYVAEDVLDEVA